jgi:DNA-binding NtrC family response regulator
MAADRRVLVVDDDAQIRESISRALSDRVDEIRAVGTAEEALGVIAGFRPRVVLTDVRLPGMDGIELLRVLRQRTPHVSVLAMSAYDDLPKVALAMREGAANFLVKPIGLQALRSAIESAIETKTQHAASDHPREPSEVPLVGRDPAMVEVFKLVGQVAATGANVLIRGESGTGKELIARAIHASSPQSGEPFVALNCTALPSNLLESELFGHVRGSFTGAAADRRGRFALAGRGTIFLDEIGDTSPSFQTKLLRVLQEREFYPVGAERPEKTNARVIAATHRDLERRVAAGRFREDLYYRLRVVEIVIPPLRERVGDIPVLAEFLLRKACVASGRAVPRLSAAAMDVLMTHPWRGNVRELENTLLRVAVAYSGGLIQPEHLGLATSSSANDTVRGPLVTLAEAERAHIVDVLAAVGGRKSRAARVLGVSRPRLDRLLQRYKIDPAATVD